MLGSIGERLEERRIAMFVGRAAELAIVAWLVDPGGALRFVYLAGPRGIGKTQMSARLPADSDPRNAARGLRDFLRAESQRLFASPPDAILDEVLDRTYFRPGAKQRAIADDLGLSYGTYRRYLRTATRRLIDSLWTQERTGGDAGVSAADASPR